jgi:hypothetical protein
LAFHSTFSPWISPMNDSAAPKPQNAAARQNHYRVRKPVL